MQDIKTLKLNLKTLKCLRSEKSSGDIINCINLNVKFHLNPFISFVSRQTHTDLWMSHSNSTKSIE